MNLNLIGNIFGNSGGSQVSAFTNIWGWWRADTFSGVTPNVVLTDKSANGRNMTQAAGTLTAGTAANGQARFVGGAATVGNADAGHLELTTMSPFGSGVEGAVKIQSRSTGKLSFFNATAVTQRSVNTILVNNVTSGGTLSTIANYTDLTTYATDAAAIRNNFFRLTEKVLKLEQALRDYGIVID